MNKMSTPLKVTPKYDPNDPFWREDYYEVRRLTDNSSLFSTIFPPGERVCEDLRDIGEGDSFGQMSRIQEIC